MDIQLPADLPLWGGWILFAVTGVMWLITGVTRIRSDSAQTTKARVEVIKMKLEMLQDRAAGYATQLRAITDVLQADADIAPSGPQIDALSAMGEEGNAAYASFAKHLRARARARADLPKVVTRLTAIQSAQVELSKSAGLGVVIDSADLTRLCQDLERVGAELSLLIREIAESPRILVGASLPTDPGNEGDIFLQIPNDEDSAAER